jgi:hypothetical protein
MFGKNSQLLALGPVYRSEIKLIVIKWVNRALKFISNKIINSLSINWPLMFLIKKTKSR